MLPLSQPYLSRELPGGRRLVSWRAWVLVWVKPVLFGLAAFLLAAEAVWRQVATVPATGEVVRVNAWEGETILDRGTTNYAPVFRYVWSDGGVTEASTGMSHPDWNFEIGSTHAIRYFPRARTDVVLPGPHNWFVAGVVGGLAAVFLIPALVLTRWLLRWKAAGT